MRKSSFATLIGVSPARVSQMIGEGMPIEQDGRVDVARGKLWIKENVSAIRSAAQSKECGQMEMPFAAKLDAAAERARLAREQADNVALKNAILRRDLVPASEVEKEWSGIIRQARAGVLAVPPRLRQLIPTLSPDVAWTGALVEAIVNLIDTELRKALEEMAHAK